MNEEQIIQKLDIQKHDFRVVIGRTKIDYNKSKEEENRKKHGYSLESAVYLLEKLLLSSEPSPFITSDPFEESGEVRHMHMSLDDEGHVVFIVTTMRPDETVRIISLRRASEEERKVFHIHTGYNQCVHPIAQTARSG